MRVVLRADASAAAGSGHVMRSLALAEALRVAGHRPHLASVNLPDPFRARASSLGVPVVDLDAGTDPQGVAAIAHDAGWVVLDGYDFDARHVMAARDAGARTLVVDDHAAWAAYHSNVVVNTNVGATRAAYAGRVHGARLLVGPRFGLLRSEFARFADWSRAIPAVAATCLVTFGGTDPARATERVVAALAGLPIRVVALVGPANPRADEIGRAGADEVVRDPPDVPELMASADLVATAASSTTLELAFMQVPMLAAVTADNQAPIAPALAAAGIAVDLGPIGTLEPARLRSEVERLAADAGRRARMAESGRRLVDGRGALRVVRAMEVAGVRLRPAAMGDADRLLAWANDVATRAASFSTAPITRPEHLAWMARTLADPDRHLHFIAEDGEPVGQVRFRRESADEAVISVAVAPGARGRGYAPAIIDAGGQAAFDRWPVLRIRAEIRGDNAASRAAFAEAGFGAMQKMVEPDGAVAMWIDRIGEGEGQ